MKPLFGDALVWLTNHWVAVALISSEIAALLPTKVNGIIQGVTKLIGSLLQRKNNAFKKR